MAVRFNPVSPRTALGRVQIYLSRNDVDEVRRLRDLFGGVTLSGKGGLRVAEHLSRAGDLVGLDLDPAVYATWKKPGDQLGFDFELQPFDWVRAQADLGLPVIRTAGQRIRAGRIDEVRAELDKPYPVHVTVVLVLDEGWLGRKHIDDLHAALEAADRDVALVFAAQFDPLDRGPKVAGLRGLLEWSARSGRQLELLRTDLIGLPAVTVGASLASIGLTTSTRHLGLPMPRKTRDDYNRRQLSPLVFVPRLLHWQRGNELGGLSPWRGAGVTDCECTACSQAGSDLLRFAQTFTTSVPAAVTTAIREHDSYALSEITQSILGSPDPRAELQYRRKVAQNLAMSVAANQRIDLEVPAWVNCWNR